MRHPLLLTVSHSSGDGNGGYRPRGRFVRLVTLAALAPLALGGCTSVSEAPADPTAEAVQLRVMAPKWTPQAQVSGDATTFSMTITNTGQNAAPNVIVSLQGLSDRILIPAEEAEEGTASQAEEATSDDGTVPGAGDASDTVDRAAWIVDEAPGGGPLASGDLYTGGRLEPGRTITMRWRLGAVRPGTFTLGWRVTAGLENSWAEATSGTGLTGEITRKITDREPEPGEEQ